MKSSLKIALTYLILMSINCLGQVRISKNQTLLNSSISKKDSTFLISHDTILYQELYGSIVHSSLFYNEKIINSVKLDSCKYFCKFNLKIDSSIYIKNEDLPYIPDCNGNDIVYEIQNNLEITNNNFSDDLRIQNIVVRKKNSVGYIRNNTANEITIQDCNFRLLNLDNNLINNQLNISYYTGEVLVSTFNKFKNKKNSELSISFSKINTGCVIINNEAERISFTSVELNTILNIQNTLALNDQKTKLNRLIELKNSFLNAQCFVNLEDSLYNSTLIFENCSFGPKASLFNLNVDTLIFKNCTDIPYPLFLSADSAQKVICIELINSNVNNLRFDYTEKFELYFDSSISEETKNNTYQSLVAKYRAEGKLENIEKIDIEYKRYQYRSNWIMWPVWLLDYIWWRYGYSKWLVILWTFVFLALFFGYNYKNWEGMRKIYEVFDKKELTENSEKDNKKREYQKATYVLLYTSFIFFSLRIDFDKLKYTNTRFLKAFFTQYIVGLICLFFLANAIFKLN